MSKLNSLTQSMAALFTPESERARKSQADTASPVARSAKAFTIAGVDKPAENTATSDSLGNGTTPGYMGPAKKKSAAAGEETEEKEVAEGPVNVPTYRPAGSSKVIRLSPGFEKLLIAQKKLCEKVADLVLTHDAPEVYRVQRRGKLLNGKSRGCILDLAPEEVAPTTEKSKKDAA